MTYEFEALGKSGVTDIGGHLETFDAPLGLQSVTLTCDEVTAVCPVTGQPDQYIVEIAYRLNGRCVESKSLKLYLQSFRNEGIFAEAFACTIAQHIATYTESPLVVVDVEQKSRGGITLNARAVVGA